MIWFLLIVVACGLWTLRYRSAALTMFFFFLTNGFQLVPVSWFDTGVGIQKGSDFALLLLLFFFVSKWTEHIKLLRSDPIARSLAVFVAFIIVGVLFSRFYYGYDISAIFRAARRFLFVLGYFVYRELSYEEIQKTLRILLFITFVQCVIFLMQLVFGVTLLNRQSDEITELSERGAIGEWKRLYNIPEYTVLFLFYALFNDSLKSRYRIICSVVLGAALVSTLHRSWLSSFIITLCFLVVFRSSSIWKKLSMSFAVLAFALVPAIFPALGERMDSGLADFSNAMNGGYDTHSNKFDDSFSFRIAHTMERFDHVANDPKKWLFGLGFLTEDSGQSQYLNFSVGWRDKYGTKQIDTGDIAWSIMFLWLGFAGTILYLFAYFRIMRRMWRDRDQALAIIAYGYMFMYLLISFTSSVFIEATTFTAFTLLGAAVVSAREYREAEYEQEVERVLLQSDYGNPRFAHY